MGRYDVTKQLSDSPEYGRRVIDLTTAEERRRADVAPARVTPPAPLRRPATRPYYAFLP